PSLCMGVGLTTRYKEPFFASVISKAQVLPSIPLFFKVQVFPSSVDLNTPLLYTLAYRVLEPGADWGSITIEVAGEFNPIPSSTGVQVLPPSSDIHMPPFPFSFHLGL